MAKLKRTMDCGCIIGQDYDGTLTIRYCPKHKAAPDLYEAAKEVMDTLEQYGGSIVPHLMDTDENAGQRLREALAKAGSK